MVNERAKLPDLNSEFYAVQHLEDTPIQDTRIKSGSGRCHGTFGELLQGVLPDHERHFLVTLPITHRSYAHFTPLLKSEQVYVFPSHKEKALRFTQQLLHRYGLKVGGILSLQSELPEGKGCASSSADLIATANAIQAACGFSISPDALGLLMASIEPSDGIMYPGIVSFYHREGVLHQSLGTLPPLTIIGVDEGGEVDTVAFNQQPEVYSWHEQCEYERLLLRIKEAIRDQDLSTIGEIATRSALLHQKRSPKMHLELLLGMQQRHRALGVVVAHSGTYIGLLLDQTSPNYLDTLEACICELQRCSLPVDIFYTRQF